MKTKQTVIAVCITALFASGAVMAKEKWEYNEDKWDDTRSYGRVTIDKDSVSAWGPWEDFVEPAAGAPSVAFAGAGAGDPYRPLPNPIPIPIPVDNVCRSGDWCGYAIYRNTNNEQNGIQTFGSWPAKPRPYAGLFALTLTPDNPSAVTIDGGEGANPGQVSWRAAPLPGNEAPIFGASHDPMDATFRSDYGWGWYETSGLHNFYASQETIDAGIRDFSAAEGYPRGEYELHMVWVSTGRHSGYWDWQWKFDPRHYLPTNNKEVAVGWFERITSYVNGDGGEFSISEGSNETIRKTYGLYVAGIATPQAYLDVQRAEGIKARYEGNSADYYQHTVPVKIDVDFGTATWSGSWNNGKDGWVNTSTDSAGNKYVTGSVGFKVDSGTISGANLTSTALSATDKGGATVIGTVQGTFFGQTAGSIGGVSDIVKAKTGTENSPGYSARSNVGVFLVDKVAK